MPTMTTLLGFEPAHNGKRIDFSLAASPPDELCMLTRNCFQNSQTSFLTMPPKCFDFNVYKQTNVNIATRAWARYIHSLFVNAYIVWWSFVFGP